MTKNTHRPVYKRVSVTECRTKATATKRTTKNRHDKTYIAQNLHNAKPTRYIYTRLHYTFPGKTNKTHHHTSVPQIQH